MLLSLMLRNTMLLLHYNNNNNNNKKVFSLYINNNELEVERGR